MAGLMSHHEVSTISSPTQQAFTGTAARVTLVSDPSGDVPATFCLCPTQDCRLLQGGATVEASATASFLLCKRTYYKITVTRAANAYLSVITPSGGTNGTLEIMRMDDESPA